MLRQAFILGLDHHRSSVALREKLALLSPQELELTLKKAGVKEYMTLSTCNRFEVYGVADNTATLPKAFAEAMRLQGVNTPDMDGHIYHKVGEDMIRHGFSVAASVESMVVGEPQILGQMKQAWQHASDNGHSGDFLSRFCQSAFKVGKRVRHETDIAKETVSVASMAVKMAEQVFSDLSQVNITVLGAGEMALSTARALQNVGTKSFTVCNRTLARAEAFAKEFEANVATFDDLSNVLSQTDVVITSTGSKEPVLTQSIVTKAMSARRHKPLFIVDIAVPRDVASDVAEINNCFVYDLDHLGRLADKARRKRHDSVAQARQIIEDELGQFVAWSLSRSQVGILLAMRDHFYQVREDVLSHKNLSAEEATRLLVNKLLHQPSTLLRQSPDKSIEETLRKLFVKEKNS